MKYRIWNKTLKAFVCVKEHVIKDDEVYFECRMTGEYCDINAIIQYCTGLKDKNGTLIYEGDLLAYPDNLEYLREVIFNKKYAAFCLLGTPFNMPGSSVFNKEMVIVGNIFNV